MSNRAELLIDLTEQINLMSSLLPEALYEPGHPINVLINENYFVAKVGEKVDMEFVWSCFRAMDFGEPT